MPSTRPLLPPSPPPPPPPEPSTMEPAKLPDPIPSPILKHSPSSSTRSRSQRSAGAEASSVTFAGELRSSSKAWTASFENFERSGSRSQRSAGAEASSVTFAGEFRSSSKASTASFEHFERAGSRPAVARLPTRRSASERSGSQRDLSDEDARFVYINDAARTHAPPARFPGNAVHTTKYSLLTFVPRNLYEQFHRVAYVYFLVLAGLNQVPQLGVFTPAASILPLAFVLGVTAVKDGYEDWRRHRSDNHENNRTAWVLEPSGGEFRPKRWKEVQVGDVVRVEASQTLPCDMVLVSTSDPTGVAYVQTTNLDGESNLKTRYAKQETLATPLERLSGAVIRCERPNRNIYGFLATVDVGGRKASLGPSNIVLRGCELKNTAWAVGVAVYTGPETKVMLNSSGAPSKRSRLETHMNRETIVLAVVLALLCSIVSLLAGIWLGTHSDELDIIQFYSKVDWTSPEAGKKYKWYGMGAQVVFTLMSAVIQFQVMIPIALFISMELVRVAQAYFMAQDARMYDERRDARLQCRALNINEDLGQVKYVFSDKTGTLTENRMEFRCATVCGGDYSGGESAGDEEEEEEDKCEQCSVAAGDGGPILKPKTAVRTDPKLVSLVREGFGAEADRARDFFLALATCNTIVPVVGDAPPCRRRTTRVVEYQGESPDEQALVYAAAAYGFMLVERTSGHLIIDVFGDRHRGFGCCSSSK